MVFTGSGVKSVRSDNKIEWSCLVKFLRARQPKALYIGKLSLPADVIQFS